MKVGLDLGFGWCKVCTSEGTRAVSTHFDSNEQANALNSSENGYKHTCFKFPSWLAYHTSAAISEMDVVTVDGIEYVVGEDAKYERQKITISDINDLIAYFNVFKKYALQKADIKEDGVQIVTGLPPIHKDKAGKLEKQGVIVTPQGFGIYLDVKDKVKSNEMLILDIGFNTVDYILVSNGVKKKGNTLEKQGVERMVEMFRSQIDISFVKQFPLQRIMEIFEKGYVSLEGEHIDLSHLKKRATDEYNEILKTRLKSEIGNLLDEIESIVLAGGGAYYIKNIRKDVYIPDTPEFSQARGYTKI